MGRNRAMYLSRPNLYKHAQYTPKDIKDKSYYTDYTVDDEK